MRTQAIIIATLLASISTAPIQKGEVSSIFSQSVNTKRSEPIQLNIIKRDLASNLVTDKAAAVVADSLVGTDTKAKAAALVKDNAAISALNTATGIATPLDTTTASLLTLSNTAASKAATDLATANTASTNAKTFDDADDAAYRVSIAARKLFAVKQATFVASQIPLIAHIPSPDISNLLSLTTALTTSYTAYFNAELASDEVNAVKTATGYSRQILAILGGHPELSYFTNLFNTYTAAFNDAYNQAAAIIAADIDLNRVDVLAANADDANSAALSVSTDSTAVATAALAAYNAALSLSSPADDAVAAANTVKTTADQALTAAGTLLTADTLADTAANAKVVVDQAAIAANTPKNLADTADALAISTKSTTDAASVALNSAQASLKTDSLPIASLSSANDKAFNIASAANKASLAASDAAKLSAAAVVTAQNVYNSALIKSTASGKIYTDALTKYTAMTHGGAKNLALTALATPKTTSSNDAISTLAANTQLTSAQSADSQAKKNVLSTSAAFTSTSTKAKAAKDALTLATTKVNNDSNAVTAAQSAYTAAKVLSDSAAANKITADHTYQCTLVAC